MKPFFLRGVSSQLKLAMAVAMSMLLLVSNHRLDPMREFVASALSPIQYLANTPGEMLDKLAQSFASRDELKERNRDLIRQQLLMSERLQRFEHLRQENSRLRNLLGSPFYMDSKKVVTEVMEVASDPYHQYVVINHGRRRGVFVGQPVVDAQGIVGQVVQVNELTSRVLLVSDPLNGVPVRITRNDVRLMANGTGEVDEMELRYVAKNTDIRKGDLLVTSGLGNRFPEGYPVARVSSVTYDDGLNYLKVSAMPLAALDRIRYLLLIWPESEYQPHVDAISGPEVSQTENLHASPDQITDDEVTPIPSEVIQ